MAQAQVGDAVKVHYTGRLSDGTVFSSSKGRPPVELTIGAGMTVPGFENALVGMNPGDSQTVTLEPEEAYGKHDEEMVVIVERDKMKVEPEVGKLLELRLQDGRKMPVTVASMSDQRVTLDANHPLAGKQVIFDIRLVEIT